MGRYIKDVQLDQPLDVVSLVMEDYVYHERFSRTDWNGEMVFYRKDHHSRERYMKWSYAGGLFHVEAWLKNPLGGEMDLDGVGGGASRREFRESMDRLLRTLKSQSPSGLAGGHVGADPLHHSADYEKEHRAWQGQSRDWNQGRQSSKGGSSAARTAVPYAIAGLFLAGILPLAGIIFGIWAIKKSGDYNESTERIIRTVCIVVISISVIRWLVSFLLGILGIALLGL